MLACQDRHLRVLQVEGGAWGVNITAGTSQCCRKGLREPNPKTGAIESCGWEGWLPVRHEYLLLAACLCCTL